MNNLTTRKIVLGLLMTLVFGVRRAGHRRRDDPDIQSKVRVVILLQYTMLAETQIFRYHLFS